MNSTMHKYWSWTWSYTSTSTLPDMRNTQFDLPPRRLRKLLPGGGISIQESEADAVIEYVCRGTCGYPVHVPHVVPEKGECNRFSSQMVKKASIASKHRKYYSRHGAGATGRRRGPGNGNKPRVMKDGGCGCSWDHEYTSMQFRRRRGEKAIAKAEAAAAELEMPEC